MAGLDYLVLVNRERPLPSDWEEKLRDHLVCTANDVQPNRSFELEERTLRQFELLREALLKDGIQIELDSGYRSVWEQKRLLDDFNQQYGEEYTSACVAKPGHSEHHTGLAVDTLLVVDGKLVDDNECMLEQVEINRAIWKRLPDYGFILRYPPDAEKKTGYTHESWHYRFVGSSVVAHEIMDRQLTLEEYLEEASGCKEEKND